jgi:ribonuclease J
MEVQFLSAKKNKLRVISLGGLQEIGKNLTVFEYGDDLFIVDCGVAFPQDEMLGIDLVLPDFTYLQKNKHKFKAIVITHGHEDHIGGLPFLLKQMNLPIYGTKLTLGLIQNKLKEHNIVADANCVVAGDVISIGCFDVEFISVTHSIADACALAITTPVGLVVHSGDFKVDHTPVDGQFMDLQRFGELGKQGVLLFLCESTNVMQEGYTMSEKSVGTVIEKIFQETINERIMIATFSSNIHRIQQIVNSAVNTKRKIAIMGRSMTNAVKTATDIGYLDIPKNSLIEVSEVKNYKDNELVLITTGSQGEPMAALSRMALSEHRQIEIKSNDKIIFSSSPIPGNEKTVSKVINELLKKGAEVIYYGLMEVHVSGHAKREEIKLLHALLKPKFLMPIHGEYIHLKAHKDLGIELGMPEDEIFLMNIGEVLEIDENYGNIAGTIQSGQVFVDGLGVGDVGNIVLRDRKHLSEDGLMIIVLSMEKTSGVIIAGPDIISRGFVYVRESENLMFEAKSIVKLALQKCEGKNLTDWAYIKNLIRDTLRDFLWQRTKRSPMILPIIMEI